MEQHIKLAVDTPQRVPTNYMRVTTLVVCKRDVRGDRASWIAAGPTNHPCMRTERGLDTMDASAYKRIRYARNFARLKPRATRDTEQLPQLRVGIGLAAATAGPWSRIRSTSTRGRHA